MNRHRYREHDVPPRSDVRSPLGRWVGESRMTEHEIEQRIGEAYRGGVIVFTRAMLERMEPGARAIVEGLARSFCGGR